MDSAIHAVQVVKGFEGWWHPEWEAFLRCTKPRFLLLKDVYSPADTSTGMAASIQAQELHMLSMGVRVAYMSHLSFAEDRMHAFCVPSLPRGYMPHHAAIRKACCIRGSKTAVEQWKADLDGSQWDEPAWRAITVGIKGKLLNNFGPCAMLLFYPYQ